MVEAVCSGVMNLYRIVKWATQLWRQKLIVWGGQIPQSEEG